MEHFDIILSLARAALGGDNGQAVHHIERLRDLLSKTEPKEAEKLTRLLTRSERRQSVAPMALEQMRLNGRDIPLLPGEPLTRNTPVPHDKETAAPLARISFPGEPGAIPILAPELSAAIEDLIGEWARTEQLTQLGVQPNVRCLFYGMPGVGKTLLAHYVAARLGLPLVEARLDGLVSSFLGTTARNIGALFDFANRYRCILFLDEFDAIAKARDDSQEVGEIKRVVNSLLQCLDARGRSGFTLAATNHEHLLDAAVWRRFDSRIHLPPPSPIARRVLLEKFLTPITLSDAEIRMLVWLTDGMSGADLETLVAGGKRFFVMRDTESNGIASRRGALLAALRRQATLNGQLFGIELQELLLGTEDKLAAALVDGAGLTQREAGVIVGFSQSKISRSRRAARVDTVP